MNTNGQQSNSETYKDFFRAIVRKTQKIVTAFYMVSDCIDPRETLRMELRSRSLELLSAVREACEDMSDDAGASIKDVVYLSGSLESLSVIASSVGLMSHMNADILISELRTLVGLIESQETNLFYARYTKTSLDGIGFEKSFFGDEVLPPPAPLTESLTASPFSFDRPESFLSTNKKSDSLKNSSKVKISEKKKVAPVTDKEHQEDHQTRQAKILEVVRVKGQATINDLTEALSTISEKTIQRELVAMVAKGILGRTGTKRWSKYSLPL